VRVIGAEGQQLGIMATKIAQKIATDEGYDLVEVAATAKPPVCRIMDYGKYKYEQDKKKRPAKSLVASTFKACNFAKRSSFIITWSVQPTS